MASTQPKTLVPLLILRILEDHSDEHHPLTRENIEEFLYKEYGITMERKAIFRHIENVRAIYKTGPVSIRWKNIRPDPNERKHCKAYYLQNDQLSELNLRVILDALSGSSYLSQSETNELADRLIGLCPKPLQKLAVSYQRIGYDGKTDNDAILMNLEAIDKAITDHKQIHLDFVHIKSDGKRVVRKDSGEVCTPIKYFVKGHNYYLVGVRSEEGNLKLISYRLSDIACVEVTEASALDYRTIPEFKHGINWDKLLQEHPTLNRLQEKPMLCSFLCLRWQIDDIKRHFGSLYRIRKLSDREYEKACKIISGKVEKRELVEVSVIADPQAAAEFACTHTVGMWLISPREARKAVCFHLRSRLGQWERLEQHYIDEEDQNQMEVTVHTSFREKNK